MGERLTWEEIKEKYPDEWVVLVDYEAPEMKKVKSGVVYAHHKEHKQIIEMQRGLKSAATLWTGKKRGINFRVIENVGG